MNQTFITILQAIEFFASQHLQIKKFGSDFPSQLPNLGTIDDAYPALFVSPTNSIFDVNSTKYTINVYCYDIIQKDRSNINTILSDTNLILNDLKKWMTDGDIFGMEVTEVATATPINNALLDYAAGWVMTLEIEAGTYSVCEIPFDNFPIVSGITSDIRYETFLTCDNLIECPTIQEIINQLTGGTGGQDIFVNDSGTTATGLEQEIIRSGPISLTGDTAYFNTYNPDSPDNIGSSFGHIPTAGGHTAFIQLFGNRANGGNPNIFIGSTFSADTNTPGMTFATVVDDGYGMMTATTQNLFRYTNGYLGGDTIFDINANDFTLYKYPTSRVDTASTTNYLATDSAGRLISKPFVSGNTGLNYNLTSGTTNFIPKFLSGNTVANSRFSDNGSTGFYNNGGGLSVEFVPGGNSPLILKRGGSTGYDFAIGNEGISQPNDITSTNTLALSLNSAGGIRFVVGSASTRAMEINGTPQGLGNVGIGTSAATGVTSARLTVSGNTNLIGNLSTSDIITTNMSSSTSLGYKMQFAGTDRMTILGSGTLKTVSQGLFGAVTLNDVIDSGTTLELKPFSIRPKLISGKNSSGVETSFININGGISGTSFTGTSFIKLGGTSNQFLMADGSVTTLSGITAGSSTDTYVTGGTISSGITTFINNTGGTFSITGFNTNNILNSSTVSGTTTTDALNATTQWRGNWIQRTYQKNEQVLDNAYLAIANKITDERPAPQPIGQPTYLYTASTISATSVNAKQVIFGNRYNFQKNVLLEAWRVNVVAGNAYSIYLVQDPTGTPIISQIINYTAQRSGWIPLNVPKTLIQSGSTYDLIATVNQPATIPVTFTANYSYKKPTNSTVPNAGDITQANNLTTTLRINKTDNDAINRASQLSALTIGDIITGDNTRWAIQSVTDNGTYFSFIVSPATQLSSTGVKTFIFETVASTPITYPLSSNYWSTHPISGMTIQGLLAVDNTYFSIVPNTTAYGVDVLIQEIVPSQDWDLQSFTNAVTSSVDNTTTITINGVTQDLSNNREWLTLQGNTGILNFSTGITLNNSTAGTINIAAMYGYIVDNETNPAIPTHRYINYSGSPTSGITVTTRNSGQASYVLLNISGTPYFQNTFPTSAERKQNIWLGKIGHPVSGVVTTVINEPDYLTSPQSQVGDWFQAINYINDGVYPYYNTGLTFNITNGNIHGNGINLHNSRLIPNEIQMGPIIRTPFLYRTQTGGTSGAIFNINLGVYDNAGVITAVGGGANTSTIQWIFCVPGAGFIVQYGQFTYATLTTAIANIGREQFIVFSNLVENAILIGVIAINKNATDLTNSAQAQFFRADKFGQIIGAQAGISTTNLQDAYNNSLQPQIVTNSTLGALQIKGYDGGSAIIFETQNSAGTSTTNITEGGKVTAIQYGLLPTITNGTVVSLANPNVLTITRGRAYYYDNTGISSFANVVAQVESANVCIALTSISANTTTDYITSGYIDAIDIAGTVGSIVYLSASQGILTTTANTLSSRIVQIGHIVKAQSGVGVADAIIKIAILPKTLNNKVLSSYIMVANNTNTSADWQNIAFRDEPIQTYNTATDVPTFVGTTAPSSLTSAEYCFRTIGRRCSLTVSLVYGAAGTAITQAVIPLPTTPSAVPNPAVLAGMGDAASEIISVGAGTAIITSDTTIPTLFRSCLLRRNSANTGFEVVVVFASAAIRNIMFTIEYQTT